MITHVPWRTGSIKVFILIQELLISSTTWNSRLTNSPGVVFGLNENLHNHSASQQVVTYSSFKGYDLTSQADNKTRKWKCHGPLLEKRKKYCHCHVTAVMKGLSMDASGQGSSAIILGTFLLQNFHHKAVFFPIFKSSHTWRVLLSCSLWSWFLGCGSFWDSISHLLFLCPYQHTFHQTRPKTYQHTYLTFQYLPYADEGFVLANKLQRPREVLLYCACSLS